MESNDNNTTLQTLKVAVGKFVKEELADVMMYCVGLANATGIDVAKAIFSKLARNEKKYPVQRYKGTYSKPKGD
jgi:NTP pyrophosphatase (non-canonical NTP hydrolase)